MPLFLGIDGGGTHTRALLADGTGRCLGRGLSDGSNPVDPSVGVSGARESIERAVNEAFGKAGLNRRRADAAFLGIAGVSGEEEHKQMVSAAGALSLAPASRVFIDHDLRIAHEGALAGGAGLVLLVGTGSACYGRDGEGASVRTGGHGSFIDDVGSGFGLGRDGLAAVARAGDGRMPKTSLKEAFTNRLGRNGLRALMRTGLPRGDVAALAVVVLEQAQGGDAIAAMIVERAAHELVLLAGAALRQRAFASPCPVALCGGLVEFPPVSRETSAGSGEGGSEGSPTLAPPRFYGNRILRALASALPDAMPVPPRLPPVAGAVLLAMRNAGHPPTASVFANLAKDVSS